MPADIKGPLTLRVIPKMLKPAAVAGGHAADAITIWELSLPSDRPDPLAFSPSAEIAPGRPPGIVPPPVRQKAAARRSTRELGLSALQAPPDVVSHSADRLARAIVLATNAPSDPRTLSDWGQQVGVSRGALRVWCRTAGVSARSCLDFLRVLRAVVLSGQQPWDLLSILDIVDQRSLFKLLDRGGVRELCRGESPTIDEFLGRQRFLENPQLLQAVTSRLKASPTPPAG